MSKRNNRQSKKPMPTENEQPQSNEPTSVDTVTPDPQPEPDSQDVVVEDSSDVAAESEVPEVAVENMPEAAPPPSAASVIVESMIDPKQRAAVDAVDTQFERYCDAMRPGKPIANEREGAANQVLLWRLIDSVLRKQGTEFNVVFGRLLELFSAEVDKGVLSPRLRYRFFGALPLGRDDATAFESILHALVMVCDPRTRGLKMKQLDMTKAFRAYADKSALARISDYFSI